MPSPPPAAHRRCAAAPASAATHAAATHAAATHAAVAHAAATVRGPAGQAHKAPLDAAARARPLRAARHARQAARGYTVHTGDTLSGIAQRFYGHASDWPYLYHVNDAKVSDPNLTIAAIPAPCLWIRYRFPFRRTPPCQRNPSVPRWRSP